MDIGDGGQAYPFGLDKREFDFLIGLVVGEVAGLLDFRYACSLPEDLQFVDRVRDEVLVDPMQAMRCCGEDVETRGGWHILLGLEDDDFGCFVGCVVDGVARLDDRVARVLRRDPEFVNRVKALAVIELLEDTGRIVRAVDAVEHQEATGREDVVPVLAHGHWTVEKGMVEDFLGEEGIKNISDRGLGFGRGPYVSVKRVGVQVLHLSAEYFEWEVLEAAKADNPVADQGDGSVGCLFFYFEDMYVGFVRGDASTASRTVEVLGRNVLRMEGDYRLRSSILNSSEESVPLGISRRYRGGPDG